MNGTGQAIRLKPGCTSGEAADSSADGGRPRPDGARRSAEGARPSADDARGASGVGSGFSRTGRVAIAALVIVAAIVSFHVRIGRRMPDFQVYRVAGTRALDGQPLYRDTDGHWQFKYLPAFAFAVAPITVFPAPPEAYTTDPRGRAYNPWTDTARVAWFACSVALLAALLALSLRLLPDRSVSGGAIVGLTILALGKFYAHELELGQTNILLAVVVLMALAEWRKGREATSGALLAVATVVKPYAIVFVPYLMVRRRWRACGGFASMLAVAVLLPAVRYGFRGNLAQLAGWWATVTTSTPPNLGVSDNISIAAVYAKWFGVGPLASWLALGTAVLLVAACARILIIRPSAAFPQYLDAALLLTLIPLLSPQGWDYVLLLATPAVMLIVNNLARFNAPARWLAVAGLLIAGLTLWDVVGRQVYTLFMVSSIVTFCYLFEIVLLLRLRKAQVA